MLSKKAQTVTMYKSIIWVFRFIIIGFLIVTFWIVSTKQLSVFKAVSPEFDDFLYSQRFVNSPYCFAELDEVAQRVYPLHVDMDRFNDEQFLKCYPVKDKKARAYRLTLDDKKIKSPNWDGSPLRELSKTVFVNGKRKVMTIGVQNG